MAGFVNLGSWAPLWRLIPYLPNIFFRLTYGD
jgi:hypothetical protein